MTSDRAKVTADLRHVFVLATEDYILGAAKEIEAGRRNCNRNVPGYYECDARSFAVQTLRLAALARAWLDTETLR